jgi:thiol-disulfide isomerase/thioredoxin
VRRPLAALAAILGFALLAEAPAADSDEISRVRADGEPAWRAAITRQPNPQGLPTSPLLAPLWFAKAPAVKIRLAPEGTFELASARGKVLLLDYWASWCAPCIKELPHLQALHVTRSDKGFLALAVNVDQDAASAAASAKTLGLSMMIGLNDPEVKATLGVASLPTLLAYDQHGRLRARWDGYANGLETEIAGKIDALLADEAAGTTRDVATVITGSGKLQVRWLRDLPAPVDGVLALSEDHGRVVASGGDSLVTFDAAGETVTRVRTDGSAGRLLDFGLSADGTRELVGFRVGAPSLNVIALRSGTERSIALPAPLLDVAAVGTGAERRLAVATMRGAAFAGNGADRAAAVEGAESVRAVAVVPGQGVLGLREDGIIGRLDAKSPAWPHPAAGAERLFAATEDGAVTAPRSVVAVVSGRFLPGEGRQLAVATYAGHLALLDLATGAIQFDAIWPNVKELAAADLDGDGRDELVVASGRSVAALGAAGR